MKEVGLDYTNTLNELDTEISTLTEKKETLEKKLEDNKVVDPKKAEEYKRKKREADELRISVAAAKEMLRTRKGIVSYTQRIEILEETTEVRENIDFDFDFDKLI